MMNRFFYTAISLAVVMIVSNTVREAQGVDVIVKVENLGSQGSLFLTPFWLSLHDGTFDTYDSGVSAGAFGGLEDLAEDGNTGTVSARFATEQGGTGGVDDTLIGPAGPPPIDPGESASLVLSVADPTVNRYFSYASMVVPSNDAFIANGNPLAHAIFDGVGAFVGADFTVFGSEVLDAGTEQNAETSVAFLAGANGQSGPNEGADENGVVTPHLGFNGSVGNPAGLPVNILGGMTASGATVDSLLSDFTNGTVPLARITTTPVSVSPRTGTYEPTAYLLRTLSASTISKATNSMAHTA